MRQDDVGWFPRTQRHPATCKDDEHRRSSDREGDRWVAALPGRPSHGHPTQKHPSPESVGGDEQIGVFLWGERVAPLPGKLRPGGVSDGEPGS